MRLTLIRTCAVALSLGIGGCMSAEEADLESADAPLFARVSYGSESEGYVAPFSAANIERSMFHARVVARSPAFTTCITNSMLDHYVHQSTGPFQNDPHGGASIAVQTGAALDALQDFGNPLHFEDFDSTVEEGAASAQVGQDTWGTNEINTYVYDQSHPGWGTYTGYEPWNWRSSDMIHEYMHARGYRHSDGSGNTSVPYMFGICADGLVRASAALCGDIHVCGPGFLLLRNSWTGTDEDWPSQPPASCVCVPDPLHVAALRTNAGGTLTAYNAGGSTLRTNWVFGPIGAWQWFYMYDRNGGGFNSGDSLNIRTWGGNNVRRTSTGWFADASGYSSVRLTRVSGSGGIANGTVVRLNDGVNYAYDGGSSLLTSTVSTGSSRELTVVEPRRDHLVYLRTFHSRTTAGAYNGACDADGDDNPADSDNICHYVHASPGTTTLFAFRDDPQLGGPVHDLPSDRARAEAAFWIVDWNGGFLRDGDTVSIESFVDGGYRYASVAAGDHTGPVTLASSAGVWETFTLNILSGATGNVVYTNDNVANDTNRVSFRAANGNYLSASPTTYLGGTIRNYATWESEWTRFDITFVSEFDRRRATW